MSHGVENIISARTGEIVEPAAYAERAAWHRRGFVKQGGALTVEEAIYHAHSDYIVDGRPVYRQRADGTFEEIAGSQELYRVDTNEPFAVASKGYAFVQNRTIVETIGKVAPDIEAHVVLDAGKQAFVVARLGSLEQIAPGDCIAPFLVASWRHDAGGALYVYGSEYRVECKNILRFSIEVGERNRKKVPFFKVKHSGDVERKVEELAQAIGYINRSFAQHAEVGRELVKVQVAEREIEAFLDEVLPLPQPVRRDGGTNPHFERAQRARSQVKAIYTHDRTCNLPSIKGSAWALHNAVTRYIDHRADIGRGEGDTKVESGIRSRLFGHASDVKVRSWTAAQKFLGEEVAAVVG